MIIKLDTLDKIEIEVHNLYEEMKSELEEKGIKLSPMILDLMFSEHLIKSFHNLKEEHFLKGEYNIKNDEDLPQ